MTIDPALVAYWAERFETTPAEIAEWDIVQALTTPLAVELDVVAPSKDWGSLLFLVVYVGVLVLAVAGAL